MLVAILIAGCHAHDSDSFVEVDSATTAPYDDDLGVVCNVPFTPLPPAPTPVASFPYLPTSNGWVAASYATTAVGDPSHSIVSFSDHLPKTGPDGANTRDRLWDAYFGIRVNGVSTWMNTVPDVAAGYVPGTGIAYATQRIGDVDVITSVFAPFLDGATRDLVIEVTVINQGSSAVNLDVFALENAHTGGQGANDGESVALEGGAVRETRGGDAILHTPLDFPSHRAAAPAGDGRNPWMRVTAGEDLGDELVSGDDVAVGFQWSVGSLGAGSSVTRGVVLSLGQDPAWIAGRSSASLYNDEVDGWQLWHAEDVVPDGLSADESAVYAQSLAVLRMAQVRETGPANGQILASLPPGQWNTSWPRDMAYATVALASAGHVHEARDAVKFVLGASAGDYADRLGLDDYLVSACRYTGDGREESDGASCPDGSDAGPNVELDDWGLYLWAFHRVMVGDPELEAALPTVQAGVADALVATVDPNRDLLVPDSSIWERHWDECFPNGRKHFTYSTVQAVAGLRFASLAAGADDPYGLAADQLRSGLLRLSSDDGPVVMADECPFLASAPEETCIGCGPLDVSVIDAIDQGVLHADSSLALGTLHAMDRLRMPGSPGYLRNDDGTGSTNPYPWYDDQEWVFADLRVAVADAYVGRATGDPVLTANGQALADWITAQAMANHGLIPELLSDGRYTAEDDADHVRPGMDLGAEYQGAVPMAGFGAGAYILALQANYP
jgi:GH15 family glucan-1,4-alpha-glucosidase